MKVNNANDPNYVPRYATWRGETVRNTGGLTQEVLLQRKFSLEVKMRADPGGRLMKAHVNQLNAKRLNAQQSGTAARPGISMNTPTQAMETFRSNRIVAIRQLMTEHDEGSLELNILQRMLERAQQLRPTGDIHVRYAPRPGGGGFNGTF